MNKKRRVYVAIFLIVCVCVIGTVLQMDDIHANAVRITVSGLRSMCTTTWIAINESGQQPPVTMRRLQKWCGDNGLDLFMSCDPVLAGGMDPWGNAIVVVAEGEALVGYGSAGPDGKWADGKGDDIVVRLMDDPPTEYRRDYEE